MVKKLTKINLQMLLNDLFNGAIKPEIYHFGDYEIIIKEKNKPFVREKFHNRLSPKQCQKMRQQVAKIVVEENKLIKQAFDDVFGGRNIGGKDYEKIGKLIKSQKPNQVFKKASWTEKEENEVEKLYREGYTYKDIANIVGRTEASVTMKIARLKGRKI